MARRGARLRLRVAPYRDLRRVAERAGFSLTRTRGSHNTFADAAGRTVVIPDHGSTDIVRPLIRKLIRDMGLTVEEYERFLDGR